MPTLPLPWQPQSHNPSPMVGTAWKGWQTGHQGRSLHRALKSSPMSHQQDPSLKSPPCPTIPVGRAAAATAYSCPQAPVLQPSSSSALQHFTSRIYLSLIISHFSHHPWK